MGLDFETKILVKEDAPELLRSALSSPRWEPKVIALSGVTDAYQPVERRLGLTRITAEAVDRLWHAAPETPVRWEPEAWTRLQTAPEFVREGIRKAAERRARRIGVSHDVVLNAAAGSDPDRREIGPQHGTKPDARIFANIDIADQHRIGRNERAGGNTRRASFELDNDWHDRYQFSLAPGK